MSFRNDSSERVLPAVSLFSGAGIGDLGLRAAGLSFFAMCELEADRSSLAALNFPEAKHFSKGVEEAKEEFCDYVQIELTESGEDLFLLSCTAPCQGMSKNGQGTLLNNIRKGIRPKHDPRNRLILPGLDIITKLRPRWVVFENVLEMRNTLIEDGKGEIRPILDIIRDALRILGYVGDAYDVEIANYGIPQRRQRLFTIYTRDENAIRQFTRGIPLIPPATHSKKPKGALKQWVSVDQALAGLPALDGISREKAICSTVPFHYVPVLDAKKYEWIRHTPVCRSAFDNQCANPVCKFQNNATHGASHDADGINRAHKDTPLYCEICGSLLPRPYTVEGGNKRIMSGYTSSYKRMDGALPSPALTRNLSYPCSDQKVHPKQNRVLSLAEAMKLQTIDRYQYRWGPITIKKGRSVSKKVMAPDSLIRLVIGESVPSQFFELLAANLINMSDANFEFELPSPVLHRSLFD